MIMFNDQKKWYDFLILLLLFSCVISAKGNVRTRTKTFTNTVKCDLCKVVAKKLANFASNSTSINQTIDQLQSDCNTKFKKHSIEKTVCDFVVKKIIELFPFAYKELSSLAWTSDNLCNVAGVCKVNCCLTKTIPEQVHISLSHDPTEMQVMWTTLVNTKTHKVIWGLEEDNLNETNPDTGTSTTYTHFGWVGHFHKTKMLNLKPNTKYFYQVGDKNGGYSQTFSFKTFHQYAGSNIAPLKVASVGDMGYANNSDMTIQRLSSLIDNGELDMVIHNGDISYADGEYVHWDVFMRKIEPVASRVPYQVSPGNHEFYFNFSAYKHRFIMTDEGQNDNLFYGVSIGSGVYFLAMDTESWYDRAHMSKEQVSWIDKQLMNASSRRTLKGGDEDGGAARWKIVYGHRPLYCSNHGGQDIPHGNTVLRKAVEQVLVKHKVDLVIQAHEHDYERTYPVYQSKTYGMNYTNPLKPIYIVNGAAGNRERNEKPPGNRNESYWPSSLNRTRLISFGLFTITSNSLKWEQRVSSDNSIQDSFEILKN